MGPHMNAARLKRAGEKNIEHVIDLIDLPDEERDEILQMSDAEMQDVIRYCNRYPSVDVTHAVDDSDDIHAGSPVTVTVQLEREEDDGSQLGPVIAPHYPVRKSENWWLIVGKPDTNNLLAIKRVPLQNEARVQLEFDAPAEGAHNLKLYLMCDAYQGCDQDFEFSINVLEALEDDDSSEDEDEEEDDE